MPDVIQLLPDHVANQIAAGEVVQRPASVVKELIENAIDAEADHIKLIIKEAGKTLIQVVDNGIGMSVTDARLCFERHATSKIRQAEDLFTICTKGFRGEAMASIAAIAHVVLETKSEKEETGTRLLIEGSTVTNQEVCITPKGTSISVKNLFYNIPARRNFLKSTNVELRHIIDEFHRVAISHPSIRFDMFHNGSEAFNLPISNYRQRIVNIFGGKTNEKLVPIQEETDLVRISGFIGKPEFAKRTRGEQFFFVNNRFIKSGYLHHAVTNAFDGLLKDKAHPTYFIFLEVDPSSIDINIHPTKTEIKFEDEHALYAILRATIKHSLGQFSVAPVLDFTRDRLMDTPYEYKDKPVVAPSISVNRDFNPFRENAAEKAGFKNAAINYKKPQPQSWEALYSGMQEVASPTDRKRTDQEIVHKADNPSVQSQEITQTEFHSVAFDRSAAQESLFIESGHQDVANTTVYQLHRKYIITTIKSGLIVIHQHRAHFRILYEELLRTISNATAVSQQLLFPIELMFTTKEITLFERLKEHLELTGFVFDAIKSTMISVSGIPAILKPSNVQELFEKLFSDLENDVPDSGFSRTEALSRSMAKAMSIKTGAIIESEQLNYIVNSLFACTSPAVTPDNKPIFTTWTMDEIDKKF